MRRSACAIGAGLLYNHLSYDLIGDLPIQAPSAIGTRVLQQHFPAGFIGTATAIVIVPGVDHFFTGQLDAVDRAIAAWIGDS